MNGELVDRLAVNDVFIGNPISYETCDLSLSVDGEEENFLCSGLITCTGMGSHAWYYNAGGSPFSNELDGFGFRVLIPNIKRALNYSSGVVTSNHELVVCPNRDGYIVSFDSRPDVITTHIGDEIRIILAKDNPVKVITFPKDHTWR
ncbi:MAG: NAD kinase [bacterium]